jgi:hypothetical protein
MSIITFLFFYSSFFLTLFPSSHSPQPWPLCLPIRATSLVSTSVMPPSSLPQRLTCLAPPRASAFWLLSALLARWSHFFLFCDWFLALVSMNPGEVKRSASPRAHLVGGNMDLLQERYQTGAYTMGNLNITLVLVIYCTPSTNFFPPLLLFLALSYRSKLEQN